MNLDALKESRKVVGTKQTIKAIQNGSALKVFIAGDAESHIIMPLYQICNDKDIIIIKVDSMAELGKACGIDVGTASAAIIK